MASLKKTLSDAVVTIISAIGDVAKDVEYHHVIIGGYDTDTDQQMRTEVTFVSRSAVYKEKVESQDYKKTDLFQTKVLVPAKDFESHSIAEPSDQDYFIIDGVKYEIKDFTTPPGNPCFIFVVRQV